MLLIKLLYIFFNIYAVSLIYQWRVEARLTHDVLLLVAAVHAAQEQRGEDEEDDGHDDGVPVRARDAEGARRRRRRRRRRARRLAVHARAARLPLRYDTHVFFNYLYFNCLIKYSVKKSSKQQLYFTNQFLCFGTHIVIRHFVAAAILYEQQYWLCEISLLSELKP